MPLYRTPTCASDVKIFEYQYAAATPCFLESLAAVESSQQRVSRCYYALTLTKVSSIRSDMHCLYLGDTKIDIRNFKVSRSDHSQNLQMAHLPKGICPLSAKARISFMLNVLSIDVYCGNNWLCTRGCSIAAPISSPQSIPRITCTTEPKMREPPEPPATRCRRPSGYSITTGAMDDRGRFPG